MLDGQTNTTGTVMPVTPMYGGGSGFGGFGDNGWWIILLFVLMGGWGNGFGNQGGMGGMYPWLNQSNQINDGFANQANGIALNGIQQAVTSGFGDVQTALCGGFAGVNASINGAQNAIAQQMYTNQISDLERSFAAQTANTQGMTGLQAQLAQCCCDNKTQGIQNTQMILDKLCQLELDGVKNQLAQAQRENVGLQNQLNMANLAASQTAQNAFIQQGFSNEVDALYNRLNSCPVPTTPVYGRTPIFTCNNQGCGCGCGNT